MAGKKHNTFRGTLLLLISIIIIVISLLPSEWSSSRCDVQQPNLRNVDFNVTERILTYPCDGQYTNVFGPWVMHEPGWDRYLMFFSKNSPIDGYWADRIYVTWHYGDGKDPSGWEQPLLLLEPEGEGVGSGEDRLIGDPSVVYWNGKWHMYYEGTDQPDGNNNSIFHAVADDWSGPWIKKGMVELSGNHQGSGLSWPTVYVENNELYLFYTDGSLHLLCAKATDSTGQNFTMLNGGNPIISAWVNRAQVIKLPNGTYLLTYDIFGQKEIYQSYSDTITHFPVGRKILEARPGEWDSNQTGLPCILPPWSGSNEWRIYYTGRDDDPSNGNGDIGVAVIEYITVKEFDLQISPIFQAIILAILPPLIIQKFRKDLKF